MKQPQFPSAFLSALFVCFLCAAFFILSITHSEEQVRADNFAYYRYMETGDIAGAIRTIDAMLKKDPDNPVLYANKAFAFLAPDTCLNDAVAYLEGKSFQTYPSEIITQALVLFGEASRLSPNDPVFLHNMGWLNFATGDTVQAIRYLHHAVMHSPFDPICLVSCGLLAEHTADSVKAADYYARALTVNPSLWDSPFFNWLHIHRAQWCDYILAKAIQSVTDELTQDPGNSIIQARLAKLLYAQGNIPIAQNLLQSVIRQLPNLNRSWLLLGLIREQDADLTEAEKCYKKAIFLDNRDPLPPMYLARLMEHRKDTARSAKLYDLADKNANSYRTLYWQTSIQVYGLRIWINEYYPGWLLPWLTPVWEPENKNQLIRNL